MPGVDGVTSTQWLSPDGEQHGVHRYLETLRERGWLIVAVVALAVGSAVAYLELTEKTYRAEAELLVTPVPGDHETLGTLGVLRDSGDPSRDVETVARLATAPDVAERVKRMLGLRQPIGSLLADVDAVPVAQSSLVAVTVEASTPERAQALADAFGKAAVADRTEQFHRQVDNAVKRLRSRIRRPRRKRPLGQDQAALRIELAELRALTGAEDPTVRLETPAAKPTSAASPRPKLTLAGALIGGLVLGIGGAFAFEALDPLVRRHDQLRRLYRVPVLARIPRERRGGRLRHFLPSVPLGRPATPNVLRPEQLSRPTLEAYRTLRTTLTSSRLDHPGGRTVLVTASSSGEGTTTTALNLAAVLAATGDRVTLVETDLRRPTLRDTLRLDPPYGIENVLLGSVPLSSALMQVDRYGKGFRALVAKERAAPSWLVDLLALPVAEAMLEEAAATADYVVVDSPPLAEVVDALLLARKVDDVVVVVRLEGTRLSSLAELGELLGQHGITPSGFAVVAARHGAGNYRGGKRSARPYVSGDLPSGRSAAHER